MEELLLATVQENPTLAGAFMMLGVLRAVFKPLMSLAEAYVLATPSKSDDQKLEGVKASKVYKALVWVFDYLVSVKVDKIAK